MSYEVLSSVSAWAGVASIATGMSCVWDILTTKLISMYRAWCHRHSTHSWNYFGVLL